MSTPRFFLTSALEDPTGPVVVPLSAHDLHHAVSVLRLRRGDEIELVEPGSESAWLMRITRAGAEVMEAEPLERLRRAHHPSVTLVQGVAKGDKMDAIVRQAIEVGAAEILPVLTERTVVRLSEKKRAEKGERWRRVAKAAAEQSHRGQVPPVRDPMSLKQALPLLAEYDGIVVLWEDSQGHGLEAALASWVLDPSARIALVIGPEGGLSADEVQALTDAGGRIASLGSGILRTETAAVVALALALHAFGGLGRD